MFDLTFLGTSASVPSAERSHPGLLVEAGSNRILVDCGEGTQRQLLRSGAGFRRLDRLLLTHGASPMALLVHVRPNRLCCPKRLNGDACPNAQPLERLMVTALPIRGAGRFAF